MDKNQELNIFFFPLMAQGHTIPIIDMAKLFALRGLKVTIITTPLNFPIYSQSIQAVTNLGIEIQVFTLKFPCLEVGLPESCQNLTSACSSPDLCFRFLKATTMLEPQLELLLQQHRPDCLISDMFFPWTTDIAAKHGIPRVVFDGSCTFASSAAYVVETHKPYTKVLSNTQLFKIPDFPDDIWLTKNELPDFLVEDVPETIFSELYLAWKEAEGRSYGTIRNSFYELEPAYADYYRKVLGRQTWLIGPVSLCNRGVEDKTCRGTKSSIDEQECLKWLDSKKTSSVVYISFGSLISVKDSQLLEIAVGLEASGQNFIWVLKAEETGERWLPEGFEKKATEEGKGLIIRGWAPQVLILEHQAIGGFVTHCGWNSVLEAVASGVPMITWPCAAEQFYNEKLITKILRIGIGIGAKKWTMGEGPTIGREAIEKAVTWIMTTREAEEMRREAKKLGEMAKKATKEGGSSFLDLESFIEKLSLNKKKKKKSNIQFHEIISTFYE